MTVVAKTGLGHEMERKTWNAVEFVTSLYAKIIHTSFWDPVASPKFSHYAPDLT